MTEEYYEKKQMEEDLGTEIEPPTEADLVDMESWITETDAWGEI